MPANQPPTATRTAGADGPATAPAPQPQTDDGQDAPIRVLVADDHRIVREGLVLTLGSYGCVKLVGEAQNGQEAIDLARRLQPEVVVMDVSMPVLDGIEATRRLSHEQPEVKVIGLSMHDSEEIRHALINAGAAAYLTKDGASDELIETIRRCAD